MIGKDISISVVDVEGGRVRLAISAPVEIPILRSELVAATAVNRDSAMEDSDPAALLELLGGNAEGGGGARTPAQKNGKES